MTSAESDNGDEGEEEDGEEEVVEGRKQKGKLEWDSSSITYWHKPTYILHVGRPPSTSHAQTHTSCRRAYHRYVHTQSNKIPDKIIEGLLETPPCHSWWNISPCWTTWELEHLQELRVQHVLIIVLFPSQQVNQSKHLKKHSLLFMCAGWSHVLLTKFKLWIIHETQTTIWSTDLFRQVYDLQLHVSSD